MAPLWSEVSIKAIQLACEEVLARSLNLTHDISLQIGPLDA
jgi:hypothetical protein